MISHRISKPYTYTPIVTGPATLNPIVYLPGETKQAPTSKHEFLVESEEAYKLLLENSPVKPGDIIGYEIAIKARPDDPNLYCALVLGFVKFDKLTYGYSDKPKYILMCSLPPLSSMQSACTPYLRPDDAGGMAPLPEETVKAIKSNAILSNRIEQIKREARTYIETTCL